MKRLVILLCLASIGAAAFVFVWKQTNDISLLDASAVQSSGNPNMFMVSLNIKNTGGPDRLLGVSSPSAPNVSIMNPSGDDLAIVIPQNGDGILAMDGAHIMLIAMPGTFGQGTFLPLDLTFEQAGSVSVRVQNTGPAVMDHSLTNGITDSPTPSLGLAWDAAPDVNGAKVKLNMQNFTLKRTEDGAAHVPNHGHAHVYLNGLKLGRLYSDTYEVGALSPGKYTLSVALNSNDHRPYVDGNGAVMDTLEFEISK